MVAGGGSGVTTRPEYPALASGEKRIAIEKASETGHSTIVASPAGRRRRERVWGDESAAPFQPERWAATGCLTCVSGGRSVGGVECPGDAAWARLGLPARGGVVRRFWFVGLVVCGVLVAPAAAAGTGSGAALRTVVLGHVKDEKMLSSGARGWLLGPQKPGAGATASAQTPSFGSNVDAALPQEDLGGGQSETAIAAANAGGQRRVLAAWNDASAFLQPNSTLPQGSGTGVGYSSDGGHHFRDLVGLPNANPDQQWVGDPSVSASTPATSRSAVSISPPSPRAWMGTRRS